MQSRRGRESARILDLPLPPLTGIRIASASTQLIDEASCVLVLGTSLATYSAYRLIKQAVEAQKPVLMVSLGPSRADALSGVEKIEMTSGPVLEQVLNKVIGSRNGPIEQEVRELMRRGVVTQPKMTRQPRAEG